tara:strand:+ start:276 stop:500 length:225 start_codon:yes stop_codon:yes gene_type:complete
MAKSRELARAPKPDGILVENEDVFENNLTVPANYNMAIVGPVTIPDVTVTGNLNAIQSLNITGTLTITGSLNIV